MMQPDDPPFLTVGTEVSAKYKGAFCEAKVNKVVKVVKVKVSFKCGLGSAVLSDDNIKGVLKVGADVKALHPDKSQHIDGVISKIQDCSQYTVVFDDGDITTLRRSSLCLKSGRHFAESETLDQLPLTHPEHFGTPVVGGRRSRRSRHNDDSDEGSSEEDVNVHRRHRLKREEWEADMGKVVCVEVGDKKKQKDNWFPGLVVAPTAQDSVKIETKKDYLVRSFQDGRYYTVPKKEASTFSREIGSKVTQSGLRAAVEKALLYIDRDELPPHWDRDLLFGVDVSDFDLDRDSDSDSSDDEPREEKDHFVAQLYKFMEECGNPINKGPTLGNKDLDLYKLFKVVQALGGFNRVMNQNQWKVVSVKMGLHTLGSQASNLVKASYKKYLQSFEDFYRKLGCTMVSNPRGSRTRHRSGRSLIRDCDKNPRPLQRKGTESCESAEDEDEEMKTEEKRVDTPTRKETRKRESTEETRKRETTEETRKRETTEETEKKKDEGKYQRNKTPPLVSSGASSPATRERSKESKTQKSPDGKTKSVKKETKEEEPKSCKEEKKEESDSEAETRTRSLRSREEKESELPKKIEMKIKQEHERSTSCNSTSSSSSSTCTSSSVTDGKNSVKSSKFLLRHHQISLDDLKKRGRRKKEVERLQLPGGKPLLPSHIPVCVGDKLRVLYGPNKKESKVTYEAKVLEVDEERLNKMYYVHYLGWNSRYDEWVMRQRIAQNLTWGQVKNKRSRSGTGSLKEKEGKEVERCSSWTSSKRGCSADGKKDGEPASPSVPIKATTRSDTALSGSLTPDTMERRRSKRKAVSAWIRGGGEVSDSDDFESGTETCSEKSRTRRVSDGHIPSSVPTTPGNLTPEHSQESKKDEIVKVKALLPTRTQSESSSMCGKDIDLKAIESEMKGLDRPVKKEEGLTSKELGCRILATVIPGSLTITEKKKHDPKKPHDSPVKRMEIPVRLVPAHEIMGQIKPQICRLSSIKKELEEDIYEFKEPEPFEMGEIRTRKETKSRNAGSQEDQELEGKAGKRKGRQRKDSESEGEAASLTPQKRLSLSRESKDSTIRKETPSKKDAKEVKKKDYSRKAEEKSPEAKDRVVDAEVSRADSPPCLQLKETEYTVEESDKPLLIDFLREGSRSLPLELKDLKLESIDGKELHMIGTSVIVTPKKLPAQKDVGEAKVEFMPAKIKGVELQMTSRSAALEKVETSKDPQKVMTQDTSRSKPVTVMTRISGQPGHVLAQAVMPSLESRVMIKNTHKGGTVAEISQASKSEEKADGKMLTFSQRQQHIFPHLLKRSDEDLVQSKVSISSAIASSPPGLGEASSSGQSASTETDKSKSESTVEKSIEAVVLRARQEPTQVKDSKGGMDKRRKSATGGRGKKVMPDTSEDSDSDFKGSKGGDIIRQKRSKGSDSMERSPSKRSSLEEKSLVWKCDDEERANDADEEDEVGIPLKILSKEADKRRKELESENLKEAENLEKETRLLKKRRRSSVSSKRTEENEETCLGDLLCEETIPPGSPLPHEHLIMDSDSSTPSVSMKQEMPFASVPTGSSFGKRGGHTSVSPGHLQASLQQIHPGVSIQSIPQPSASQSYSASSTTIHPHITITSLNPMSHMQNFPQSKSLQSGTKSSIYIRETLQRSPPGRGPLDSHSKDIDCNIQKGSLLIIPSVDVSAQKCLARPMTSIDNTPPTTPESIISNLSDSPRRENEGNRNEDNSSTKSGQNSSEMEYDKTDNYSEDSSSSSRHLAGSSSSSRHLAGSSNTTDGSVRRPLSSGTVIGCTQSNLEGWDPDDSLSKKRKRGIKFSPPFEAEKESVGKSGLSPHQVSSGGSKRKRQHSLSKSSAKDDEYESSGLAALSIAACKAACKAGSARSRYNFCQELDPDLDATKRISVLQGRMQDLKRTYLQVKSELASVERRRKKIRKREKEKEAAPTQVEGS